MLQQREGLVEQLNEQLGIIIDGGFAQHVALGGASPAEQALERRINAVIDAARMRAAALGSSVPSTIEAQKLGWVLDSIVENAPIMLFLKNAEDLTMELWNKQAERIAGVKAEDILGKTGLESFPREQMDEFNARDRAVLDGKRLVAAEEALTGPEGTRWLYTKKIPLLDEAGAPRYLLGISEDITERRRATEELRGARDAAQAANQAKTDFFANVSHELRTPLTLILGTVDSILLGDAGEVPPKVRERLDRLRRNGARLAALVNDLLEFSRLEAGKATVTWQPVPVAEILVELVEDAQITAQSRGLTLACAVTAEVGDVALDRRMFEKIAINLVGNALKFTPEGGRIDVTARVIEGDLELVVADTGVGIPAGKLSLLFERFQQVDSSASRKYEGTGIGLALVKKFAELMGGRAGVESVEGEGARFFVRIPRRTGEAGLLASQRTVVDRGENPFAHLLQPAKLEAPLDFGGKPRLILAEDNPDMRAYVVDLLANDYDIVAVENGRQALESARAYLPDAIVSDVMMPEMNGFELVAAIKADPALRQVPVLLLTARSGQEAIASGLDGGADDYLCKPFSPAELRARVAAARRLHRAYQDLALQLDELTATRDELAALTGCALMATGS